MRVRKSTHCLFEKRNLASAVKVPSNMENVCVSETRTEFSPPGSPKKIAVLKINAGWEATAQI